jgi:acyl-CoA synthetase (AMP-forming)/AMP-acid ligase II
VVSPCYGLAEATLAVSLEAPLAGYRVETVDGQPCVTCGSPVGGFELKHSSAGALMIRGPSVARTAFVGGKIVDLVDAEGYYDTKDIALSRDGRLVILGRTDEMFVVNGENRFPYDIEEIVREVCGAGTRAACLQVPAPASTAGRQIAVVYERRSQQAGEDDSRNELIRQTVLAKAGLQLGTVLAVDLKTIPVTPSGKIQRVRFKAEFARIAQERSGSGVSPALG